MSIFSRKGNNDFFELLEESLNKEKDDITIENAATHSAPHALTAKEVLSDAGNNVSSTTEPASVNPLEALKSRMMHTNQTEPVSDDIDDVSKEELQEEIKPKEETATESLLEKCKAYTVDDTGRDVSNDRPPLYRLQSIAEILRSEGENAISDMSKKYNITFDDLGKNKTVDEDEEKADEKNNKITEETTIFDKMVADSVARDKEQDFVKTIADRGIEIKELDTSIPDISDIDTADMHPIAEDVEEISNTGTIRFTPIKDEKFDTNSISISSTTKPIDLSGEFFDNKRDEEPKNNTLLEETDFERYTEKNEYSDKSQNKKFLRKFSISKRNAFLQSVASFFILLIFALFLIPTVNYFILADTMVTSIIFAALLFIDILVNMGMFLSLKNLFNSKCSASATASIASLFSLGLAVCAVLTENSAYELLLLTAIMLFICSLSRFWKASANLASFRQISVNKPLTAIGLVTDSATAYAMAKNAVDGDALVAIPKKTDFVKDFVKHINYGSVVFGKLGAITVIANLLAIACGVVAYVYFDGIFASLTVASAISLTAALPTLFTIGTLPVFAAAKKLSKEKAMISGNTAAERIELANAAVVSSCDIFPSGSVTLQDIKVLSDNNFDDIIMRATSLTKAVNSTLYPIFQQIAKTNSTYKIPDSDTVKYEDRMGISGWVDNELLFIGNRTLMQAHEIDVPSIEVDRRILRNGYFPVYVANSNKACALIIIQYNPDETVVRKLRETTKLGITLLVENSDPNINEEMICDYLGLYDGSVKIMSNAGVHMFKTTAKYSEECSSPAAFSGSPLAFVSIINCASRVKKSNSLLTALYVILSVIGVLLFIYSTFSGTATQPITNIPLIYGAASAVVSYVLYLFKKP